MIFWEPGDTPPVRAVPFHPQAERLQPAQDERLYL